MDALCIQHCTSISKAKVRQGQLHIHTNLLFPGIHPAPQAFEVSGNKDEGCRTLEQLSMRTREQQVIGSPPHLASRWTTNRLLIREISQASPSLDPQTANGLLRIYVRIRSSQLPGGLELKEQRCSLNGVFHVVLVASRMGNCLLRQDTPS